MENLEKKYKNVSAALETLKKSVMDFEKVKSGQKEDKDNYLRDAVIKRFEYSLDTTWKYLKTYLEKVVGMTLTNKGPKPIFRECLKAGLLTEEEATEGIKMVDQRNMTSHIYKEEIANEISKNINKYYELMQNTVDKTRHKNI